MSSEERCCCPRPKAAIGIQKPYSISQTTWAKIMILINLCFIFIGILDTAFGVWAIASQDSVWIRVKWDGIPVVTLFAGIMISVFGVFGLRSGQRTYQAREFTEDVRGTLVCYFNLLLILLIVQMAAVGVISRDLSIVNNMWNTAHTESGGDVYSVKDPLEDHIKSLLVHDSDYWKQYQNDHSCCGFDDISLKAEATGDICKSKETTSILTCDSDIINSALREMQTLLIVAVIVLELEIIGLIAAVILCCFGGDWTTEDDDDPKYSRLPAGDHEIEVPSENNDYYWDEDEIV